MFPNTVSDCHSTMLLVNNGWYQDFQPIKNEKCHVIITSWIWLEPHYQEFNVFILCNNEILPSSAQTG